MIDLCWKESYVSFSLDIHDTHIFEEAFEVLKQTKALLYKYPYASNYLILTYFCVFYQRRISIAKFWLFPLY